jgi:hypothetical protein
LFSNILCHKPVRQTVSKAFIKSTNAQYIFFFLQFLNDLETFLEAKNVTGLESISSDLENQLNIYLKLFIILYADDTVILSESESDLQAQLDAFHKY